MFKHRNVLLVVLAIIAGGALLTLNTHEATAQSKDLDLRIVYAGHPGSAREKDFVQFLAKYFTEVKTADLATFRDKQAEGFDVVILDYDGDGFKSPRPNLSKSYSRATVTVGVVGAFICGSRGLKSGYL